MTTDTSGCTAPADLERLAFDARQAMLDYGGACISGEAESIRDSTTRACAAIDALKLAAIPAPDRSAQVGDTNMRSFLDGGDAAREGEAWLQAHITDEMRAGWPHNEAKVERYQCGGDNHMAVLWLGMRPLASFTVLRDCFNRSKLLLWDAK